MKKAIANNSLALVFGLLFLVSLVAQAFSGWQQFNDQQVGERLGTIGWWDYVTSADFAVDVSENWQSEFLQFLLYLLLTVWLLQRGSPESKELDKAGLESDEEQKVGEHAEAGSPAWAKAAGWRRSLYSNSLAAMVGAIFLASWLVQSVAGWAAYNETRLQQMRDPIGWGAYLLHSDFWARTLQNWQSEFLAVGSFAVMAIYLRQRGSPESKPVGAPHTATGIEG
ncbi:membrane protein implicated in regulation of membrane protease activity [Nocardioides thalensis]|uniref:Membrane protein implicated in regulation of membrane protease activity n=1 Tax=Nocardioides thalensis TaxID=1914755 RepID=A0A853C8J7_9ACTN|nr:DUF6766 family protein [Nocardioides thalensis]NYJ03647.1 membrane protein implicated in regulation of membrane protease activity [Nocardioides thalensis]